MKICCYNDGAPGLIEGDSIYPLRDALASAGAARAGATMHLMPGITVLLSMLFLAEYPSWYHAAGIALILAGVALSSLRASSACSTR